MGVNFAGGTAAVVPLRPGASVIVNTSVAAQLGVAGLTLYSATKGALGAAVRSLAVELAPRQIRVNAVSPGVIRTAIQAKFEKLRSLAAGQ